MTRRTLAFWFVYNLFLAAILLSIVPPHQRNVAFSDSEFSALSNGVRWSNPFPLKVGDIVNSYIAVVAFQPFAGIAYFGSLSIVRQYSADTVAIGTGYTVPASGDYRLVASVPSSCTGCGLSVQGSLVVTTPFPLAPLSVFLSVFGVILLVLFPIWHVWERRPLPHGPVADVLDQLDQPPER